MSEIVKTQIVEKLEGLPDRSLQQVLKLVEHLRQQEHEHADKTKATQTNPKDLDTEERLRLFSEWTQTFSEPGLNLPDEAFSRDSIYGDE